MAWMAVVIHVCMKCIMNLRGNNCLQNGYYFVL